MVATCSKHIHSAGILTLAVDQSHTDTKTVFCCSSDDTFGLWTCSNQGALDVDLRTTANKCLGVLSVYGNDVYLAETSQDVITGIDQQIVVKYGLAAFLPSHPYMTFSMEVTALACDGTHLIAGSNDFVVKCIRLDAVNNKDGPVNIDRYECDAICTSISISTDGYYFSLSTADGNVQIRPIRKNAQGSKKPIARFKACGHFTHITIQNPRIQCCWHPQDKYFYIPANGGVIVVDCTSWERKGFLTHSDIANETFSIIVLSKMQADKFFMAASTLQGTVVVWHGADSEFNLINIYKKIQNGLGTITSIIFHPQNDDILLIAYSEGYICSLTNVKQADAQFITTNDLDVLFDDSAAIGETNQPQNPASDVIDLDDIETDLGLIKSRFGFDQNGEQITATSLSLLHRQIAPQPPSVPCTTVKGMCVPKPFAIGSTPICEEEGRYLVWNLFGIIKSYKSNEDSEDSTIEVNFHDATIHSEIIIDNTASKYVFGDINSELFALASKRNSNKESELYVHHVTSWDHDSRKWTQTMNSEEHIDSLCVGQEFIAIYTNLRFLRIFTAAGTQRYVISLAGHLLTMCGSGNRLAIATATGAVLVESEDDYEHQISVSLYIVSALNGECSPILEWTEPLPLSPYSQLYWLQFSSSGNLVTMDDECTVRIYLRQRGVWIPILVGTELLKDADADFLWPIAVTELPRTQFRYVYCKNCKYPIVGKTQPPPTTVAFGLPVVNPKTDRGKLEAELMTLELQQVVLRCQNEMEPEQIREMTQLTQNYVANLLKLFSISCQMNRENRAAEIAHRATNSKLVQGFCNYATKAQRPNLSEKVANIGRERLKAIENQKQRDALRMQQKQNSFTSTHSLPMPSSQFPPADKQFSAIVPSKALIPKRKATQFGSTFPTSKNTKLTKDNDGSTSNSDKVLRADGIFKPTYDRHKEGEKENDDNDEIIFEETEVKNVAIGESDMLDTSTVSNSTLDASSLLFTHSMIMMDSSPASDLFKKARTTPASRRGFAENTRQNEISEMPDFFDSLTSSSSDARKQKF